MATGLERIKRRIKGARKKVAKLTKVRGKAKKRIKKFGKKLKVTVVGTPKYRRAKKKVRHWRGVKHYARTQRAFWKVILNRRLAKKIAYLRAHPPQTGMGVPDRPWNPYKRKVCGWMVKEIDKIYAAGWRGVVVSGVRTPDESEGLCYAMCHAPSCPGRCAGRSSNHNATTCAKYQGAVDVTNFYNFGYYARKAGSVLKNALPIDPVHYSYTGR